MAIKNLTSLFPLIFLSKHINLYALGRLKWILDIVWPLNQHFNLKNRRNWRTTFFMLRFLIGIICILLQRPKKLTLATVVQQKSMSFQTKGVNNTYKRKVRILQHSILHTVNRMGQSLISMRPIYYFNTWAIIWQGNVPVFLKICTNLQEICSICSQNCFCYCFWIILPVSIVSDSSTPSNGGKWELT